MISFKKGVYYGQPFLSGDSQNQALVDFPDVPVAGDGVQRVPHRAAFVFGLSRHIGVSQSPINHIAVCAICRRRLANFSGKRLETWLFPCSWNYGIIGKLKITLEFAEEQMKILEVEQITRSLLKQLIVVWEKSVKATHLFLSEDEVEEIKKYIPQALNGIAHLIIAQNESGRPVAFMGIEEQKLEMLFIAPEERGKGLGRKLIQYGIENCSVSELAVNEQNPLAIGFYERMGFRVYKRTDHDEQGNPYPLLYMKLK